jgi:putative (di)nucleoside polyphosphate hydrolase
VFVGQRIDTYKHAWQLPQGGIEQGEEPRAAALRELEEEIGTCNVKIIGEIETWLNYDLPPEIKRRLWGGRFRGQTQKWFAMQFLGEDIDINPTSVDKPEFSKWKWSDIEEIQKMAVPFKREIYGTLIREFSRFAKVQK